MNHAATADDATQLTEGAEPRAAAFINGADRTLAVDGGPPTEPAAGDVAADDAPGSRTIRRYRPLRLHARGGLGEVFVAYDQEVGREVALKSLQERHADDPQVRARFAVEAAITGRLEHPGIVAVHGFGQDEHGRLQYAMRLVRGDTLATAIDCYHAKFRGRGPGPRDPFRDFEFRHLLTRFVAVCNAVAYAHSQGVVHRDLKPGNVMLGAYGETLVVDWGLAKYVDQVNGDGPSRPDSANDAAGPQTSPGQVLGTPAYMSPEQASGDPGAVGPASDVYSLGATLYHLLTGRPPFAPTRLTEALRLVRSGSFARPAHVRRELAEALEAVCLKAMALQPVDRYASAAALAEDVERWLADEPVRAAPEPWHERFRRWRRRRRTPLAAAAVLLVTATLALSVGAVLLASERSAVLAARERSDRNYQLAGEVVNKYLRHIADDPRMQKADTAALRRNLLADAVPFYKRILEEDRGSRDPKIRADRGKALAKLGFLHAQMADDPAALDAYQQAIDVFTELVAEHPEELAWEEELAHVHNNRGILLTSGHRFEEAEPHYRAGIAIQRRHIERFPNDHVHRHELARLLANFGNMLRKERKYAEAETHFREGLALVEKLAADHPANEAYRVGLASAYHNFAHLMRETRRDAEAERYFRASLRAFEAAAKAKPEADLVRRDWAVTYDAFALFLRNVGKQKEAEVAHRKSAEIHGGLAADFPSQTTYHDHLASSYWALGMMLRETGREAEGDAHVAKALAIGERLSRENPHSAELAARIAGARRDEAHWHRKNGRIDVALQWYDRALAAVDDFHRHHQSSMTEYSYRSALVHRSRMLAEAGRVTEAVAGVDRLLARRSRTVENNYDTAVILAIAAAKTTGEDSAKHAARAVAQLERAHRTGFFNTPERRRLLETDAALAALRSHEGFKKVKAAVDAAPRAATAVSSRRR